MNSEVDQNHGNSAKEARRRFRLSMLSVLPPILLLFIPGLEKIAYISVMGLVVITNLLAGFFAFRLGRLVERGSTNFIMCVLACFFSATVISCAVFFLIGDL